MDTWDAALYDMVLHIKTMTVEDAVSTIRRALEIPRFQTTPESQAILDKLVLRAQALATA
jgi:hypothetical protein